MTDEILPLWPLPGNCTAQPAAAPPRPATRCSRCCGAALGPRINLQIRNLIYYFVLPNGPFVRIKVTIVLLSSFECNISLRLIRLPPPQSARRNQRATPDVPTAGRCLKTYNVLKAPTTTPAVPARLGWRRPRLAERAGLLGSSRRADKALHGTERHCKPATHRCSAASAATATGHVAHGRLARIAGRRWSLASLSTLHRRTRQIGHLRMARPSSVRATSAGF